MATGNNIQISLNLDDTQFKNGIKRVGQQLQSLNSVKKLKVDVDANIAPFQQALKDALSSAKKAGALSYTAKNGKTVGVANVNDAIKAYKRYIELADSAGTTREQNAYLKKANSIGAYIQALSNLGNKMKEIETLENRMHRARNTGAVRAERAKAYREEMAMYREEMGKQVSVLGRLKQLATSYLSIFTAFRYVKGLVDTTGYFEQQQVALEGILGSASAATKAIGQLKSMALQSPKQFKDLVGDTKQLSAYGIEIEKLLPTVKQLADISVGLGVDMGRLTLAYGQVKSATVLRGQELRQFTEAGVPMVDALAKKFTQLNGKLVSTSEIFELISKRQVPFEMVAEVLRDMTAEGGKFYKMQETISETLYGQVQKLKDLWTINLNDTGSSISGVLMAGVKALQLLIKESRALLWIFGAAGIMIGIRALVGGFGSIKAKLLEIKAQLVSVNASTREWLAQVLAANGLMGKTKASARGLLTIFKGIGAALKSNIVIAILSVLSGLIAKAVIKAKEFGEELNKIDKSFAKDNAKYVQGFDKLIGKLSILTEGTKKYNEALDTLKNNYGDYVNPAIINQLIAERKQLDDTAEGWGRLHDSIVAAINAKNDYERHKARKEKAAEILSDNANGLSAIFNGFTNPFNSGYGVDNDPIIRGLRSKVTNDAYDFALESFLSQGLTSKDELQAEIERSFRSYSVANNVTKYVLENIDTIWKNLTDTKGWRTYLAEHNAAENSDYAKIDKAFADAQARTSQRQEGRWHDGMSNEEYNPIKLIQAGQYDAAIAARNLIAGISQEVNNMRNNGTAAGDIYVNGEEGRKRYNEAVKELNKEFNGMSAEAFQDADKINRIAQALSNLSSSIKNSDLLSRITDITGKFTEIAGVKSGQAAQVSTNITRDFLGSGVLTHDVKDWYAQYVNKTTNETFDSVRDGIRTLYQENKKYIDSYSKSPIGANKEEVERRKAENERLKILAGVDYYDIDLSDTKKGGSSRKRKDYEFDTFINEFKSAYEMYKKAVQQGGLSMGAAFVQNNKQVQDMFGGFFNGGEFGDKFKQTKVGDAYVIDLIKDKFITEGTEKGIIDFKSAAEAVAEQLKTEAENNKAAGKISTAEDQMRAYKSLIQYIQSTFSKDNIDGFLKDLEKSLSDLSLTFDKTTKNVELYRKMIEQGTQNTLGGMIGAQYKAQAFTPQSTIMKGNIQKVVEVYNAELDKEATSNPNSEIAKTKNEQGLYEGYSLGQLNTLDDIYNALQQIDRMLSVNEDNFQTTEAGKILGGDLKPMLQSLLQQLISEISSISGKKFTGNSLSDAIANANIDMTAARAVNTAAQANAQDKQKGSIDYAAIQTLVGQSSTNATAVFDQFLAQNDFSVMFEALGKWKLVNFDDLRKKLDELTKNLAPLTKLQLTEKFNELEKKVNEFNSSTGGNLFNSMHDYNTAGKRAQSQYHETIAIGRNIKGAVFDEEEGQFSWFKNMVSADDVAILTALNAKLKEMGVNGENLSRSFKTDALKNMEQSIQSFSNQFNSMTNVVNSVVNAFKSFSKALNDVYDVMNDGENPEWMQVMDDSINDFGDAFEAIIAPITAVIALVAALAAAAITLDIAFTPLLIIMIAIIALAAAIAAIVAAFKAHDNALERSIDKMKESVEDFDTAVTNLNAVAERSTGLDKLVKRTDAVGKSISKASEYANMAAAEDAKKNTDYDKLKEYQQEQQEAEDEFKNSLLDMLDELVSSTEDWASAMGDAIRSAFQNGENAARSFRSTVKTMIGDVVENMLEMAILQPLIESAIQEWTNQDYLRKKYTYTTKDKDGNTIDTFDSDRYTEELLKNVNNSAKAEDFYKAMIGIGNTLIDTENNLPDFLQEALWYNSDTQSLSGGIESITEDTARRLEALSNSQLGALLNIQSILQNYIGGNGMYSSSPMANIQSTVALIQGDTAGIRSATQTLLNEIRAVRTTNSQPLHVTIV